MPEDPYAPIGDELYDVSWWDFTDDVDFYENLARAVDGPILELGAGSGRVALRLAEDGYDVVGIDTSASMLEAGRRRLAATKLRKGRLDLVEADMTAFALERRFGLIFVAANTFQHLLTTAEQAACLSCVAAHLAPGGIFAMSIRSPVTVSWEDAGAPTPPVLDWTKTDPETGEVVMKLIGAEADPARMVRRMTYIFDRFQQGGPVRRNVFITELRYSTQAEITMLLQHVGLRVTHVYGDYDLTPVGTGDNLIFVARAEASR
jgi:SAM-dependent methyltransferase